MKILFTFFKTKQIDCFSQDKFELNLVGKAQVFIITLTTVLLHLEVPVSLVREPVCKIVVLLAHVNGKHPLLKLFT